MKNSIVLNFKEMGALKYPYFKSVFRATGYL